MERLLATTSCECGDLCAPPEPDRREPLLRHALRLEYLTVGWNVLEGVVAIWAARTAGSVAILGFGIDSFVECASAFVLIWRLRAERDRRVLGSRVDDSDAIEAIEHRARRSVAVSLFLLAAYVALDASQTLWSRDEPAFSRVGVALIVLSLVVMRWLASAKRRVALDLGSGAMEADAFQTTACWWLSLSALVGVGLNGAFGWWWADPLAAFVIAVLVAREGHEAWVGKACC